MSEPMETDTNELDNVITTTEPSITYSAAFVDSLIHPVLNPANRPTKASIGLRVIHPNSAENSKAGTSIRFHDIDMASLSHVDPSELPLPLDDRRRVYASGIPGVRLTHPGGPLGGGPHVHSNDNAAPGYGQSPQSESAKAFLEKHRVTTPVELQKAVKAEQAARVEELRKQLRERADAKEKNRRIQERVDNLVAEREMERRVHEKAREVRQQDRG